MKLLLVALFAMSTLFAQSETKAEGRTNWMVGFDVYKALTQANITSRNRDYDDSDIEDEDIRYTSISLYLGRRISDHLQVIGMLDYDKTDYDEDGGNTNDYVYTSTRTGLGLEYNFNPKFQTSLYLYGLFSSTYTVDEEEDDKDTDTNRFFDIAFGKRIPIVGKTSFLTYSPDIVLRMRRFDSDEDDTFESQNTLIINFLKIDLLF